MSDFNHLKTWCEAYYAKTNLRIHPANVPQEVVLNEILGRLAAIESRLPDSMKAPVVEPVIETVMVRGVEIPLSELIDAVDKKKKVKK
tara:strand:+ start:2656 stop:2919 length:264 start_codon:yes stop_codon:yes gene_type:complete